MPGFFIERAARKPDCQSYSSPLPVLPITDGRTRPIAMPRTSISYLALLLIIVAQYLWIYLSQRRSRKRDELFRIITENAADIIALVDTKGRRLYNSPSYYRILGYSSRELAQTSSFEPIHPDDRFKVLEASRDARATGVAKSMQRLRHRNGTWRTLESLPAPSRTIAGKSKSWSSSIAMSRSG